MGLWSAHQLGRGEGGSAEPQGPQVGAVAGWAAEDERPVVSRGQGPTGTDDACRRAVSHSTETPAHRHIRSQFRTRQMPPERCGLRPRPLMCFQGVQGAPRNCQKELPTALCSHRAWAFPSWTGWHSTHLRAWLLSQLFQNSFLLLKYQELQFNCTDPAAHP